MYSVVVFHRFFLKVKQSHISRSKTLIIGESYLVWTVPPKKRSLVEQFRQIKCSLVEPHAEFGKGDIPNEKIRLPPLEVHFEVGGCGHTDSTGGTG